MIELYKYFVHFIYQWKPALPPTTPPSVTKFFGDKFDTLLSLNYGDKKNFH